MEKNFKEIIENVKKSTVDAEETKKYILLIKQLIEKGYKNPEEDNMDILQQYLEDYEKELEFRGNAQTIYYKMLMYEAYRRLLVDSKGNKSNFNSVIKEARQAEEKDNISSVTIGADVRQAMVSAVRYIIRKRKITKEQQIFEAIKEEKAIFAEEIRKRMVNLIRTSVISLEEYGAIDAYIEGSNEELAQLGLQELQYVKRNPMPDEQYDENGQLVSDVEDIGVLDAFSEEILMEMQLEDLGLMTAFWESKYLEQRLGISKAMTVIRELDLWGTILEEDDDAIRNLDNKRVNAALKKDLALTYLCKTDCEITSKMKRQYRRFLEEEDLSYDIQLDEAVQQMSPEISNLEAMAKDVAILECLILHQLRSKDIKVKKWGVIQDQGQETQQEGIAIAIENKNFRGPLTMEVPKYILRDFLHGSEKDFPIYDKQLDPTYSSIMSKLYLPANKFFNNTVKKAYKENPSSPLLADLAGKKVKQTVGNGEEGR